MISGIPAFNGIFLADLSNTESQITRANQEISSGFRVNQASDDPSAVASILNDQNSISQILQVQTNLSEAQTEATGADGSLQSTSSLLDELVSIAAQGASSTATAASRSVLGEQVQQIQQQLVAIANTSVGGRFIFGGDSSSTAPYTYNWSSPGGVTANANPSNTATIADSSGNQTVPRMTAKQIFDARNPDGTPAAGNVFQSVYSLGQALLTNDQSGVQAANSALQISVTTVGQATTFYGTTQNWIQQANDTATSQLNNLKQSLSSVRDTDIASAATQLSLDQTALQAALSAHGTLDNKSLFSYLG